ncbi:MAG: hypothetical protein R3B51_09705 [Thermodesulfobacteriota bacterium]
MATDYKIKLNPENFLKSGETLGGKTEFSIRTDKFKVVKASVSEEPVPDERNTVTLNGTVDFNYPVDPNILARKISLREVGGDGKGPERCAGKAHYRVLAQHDEMACSGPLEKAAGERTFELVIVGDLTPTEGNVTLGDDFIEKINFGSK